MLSLHGVSTNLWKERKINNGKTDRNKKESGLSPLTHTDTTVGSDWSITSICATTCRENGETDYEMEDILSVINPTTIRTAL
jgi:hypothetical protein